MKALNNKTALNTTFGLVMVFALSGQPAVASVLSTPATIRQGQPAQQLAPTTMPYSASGTVEQITYSPDISSTNYMLLGDGVFASGTVSTALTSAHYQMLATIGQMGLPNNQTLVRSANYWHSSGFLAALSPVQIFTTTVFVPLALIPLTSPMLNAITAPGSNKQYSVSWNTVSGATSYTLQEDTNAGFTNPSTLYSGAGTSTAVQSRDVRTAYYRVKAQHSMNGSNWSNTQSVALRWELEPNNYYTQSTELTDSGQNYYGLHNDGKDYFSINVPVSGTIGVTLTTSAGDVQLQLFYQNTNGVPVDYDNTSPSPYHLAYANRGQTGWYYIYIPKPLPYNSSSVYTLKVTYPGGLTQSMHIVAKRRSQMPM